MGAPRLLLVDDEDNLRSMLEAALRHYGFDVVAVAGGRTALEAAAGADFDVVVLDVMMPDLDGFEVCRRLRADGIQVPVVYLTARDSTEDTIEGLTIGGDDYVVKPFSLEELVVRIQAILRRTHGAPEDPALLRCGEIVMDQSACQVTVDGDPVALSPTEFNLLRFLLQNQNRVMSKGQILDHVWPMDFDGDDGIVETYIGYLRRKIDTSPPRLVHTIRGFGYTLRESRDG